MFVAPFPAKLNWQVKILFKLATILYYISFPFFLVYERFRRLKA